MAENSTKHRSSSSRRVKTESQLKSTEAVHTLYMGLVIKWGLTFAMVLTLGGLLILLTVFLVQSEQARLEVFNQIKNNIGSIIVSIGIFLGLKKVPGSQDNG